MSRTDTRAAHLSASFINRNNPLARLARPLARFLHIEAAGGLLLLAATVAALVWANSPWSASYESLWTTQVRVTIGSFEFDEDLLHVINDGLMAVFFFVVGMEIKGELVTGALRDRRHVALPAAAALGGMVVPAMIYLAFNAGSDAARGWGIPMATDIAFALGVLAVLGSRVPTTLKVFLLTLAIVDDIGAIAAIAIFYADDLRPAYLGAAAGVVVLVAVMRRLHMTYPPLYIAAGLALWLCVFEAGVHATIAGVVMGLLTPATPMQSEFEASAVVDRLENRRELDAAEVRAAAAAIKESVPLTERLIDVLHPWTSYVIVPVFALANAGIALGGNPLGDAPRVFLGVGVGLVVGKLVGITSFAAITVRAGLARLPEGVTWSQFLGAAMVAGIGFTVSLFITGLAFVEGRLADSAKVAVLFASVVAATVGSAIFVATARGRPERDQPADDAEAVAPAPRRDLGP